MIIATRVLKLMGDDTDVAIPVSVHMPAEDDRAWRCDYEIGWPEGPRRFYAMGFDAVQALQLALNGIAIDLYASRYHHAGLLVWDDRHGGYGFPLPRGGRDLAVGIDRDI